MIVMITMIMTVVMMMVWDSRSTFKLTSEIGFGDVCFIFNNVETWDHCDDNCDYNDVREPVIRWKHIEPDKPSSTLLPQLPHPHPTAQTL